MPEFTNTIFTVTDKDTDDTCNLMRKRTFPGLVGLTIFCPGCRGILDAKKAVEISIYEQEGGELKTCKILCARCYDTHIAPGLPANDVTASETNHRIEITDGRELFKRK